MHSGEQHDAQQANSGRLGSDLQELLERASEEAEMTDDESFFGQKIRTCVLCGYRGVCEYSHSDNGPICFDGIACVGRTVVRRSKG